MIGVTLKHGNLVGFILLNNGVKIMEEIKIGDLLLRKPNLEDAFLAHVNFFSSEKTAKYMYWRVTKNEEEVKQRIERWLNTYKDNMLYFIIFNNEPIGFLTSVKFDEETYGDIGLCVGEKFIKKGNGSKILSWLVNDLKSKGAKKIYYTCMKENIASIKLAEKIGFKYQSEMKKINPKNNTKYIELTYLLNI